MQEAFSQELLDSLSIVDWGYTEELEPKSYTTYEKWVERGDHGPLKYLADYRKEKRRSLCEIYPEAKSAIVFLFSYHAEKLASEKFYKSEESNSLKVASYVTGFEGDDYHYIIGKSLTTLGDALCKEQPELEYKLSLDIHPVLERDLAYRSGLGWFGKNSMLISKEYGSFVMIGSLILNQTFEAPKPELETDHCGQCRACVEACPTDAINEDSRTLIAQKCISTWTIEHFKEGPEAPSGMEKASGEIFGCDICQDVCPWNHRPVRMGLEGQGLDNFQRQNSLVLSEFLLPPPKDVLKKLDSLSGRGFSKIFKRTPLGRTGKYGLLKNLKFWVHRGE